MAEKSYVPAAIGAVHSTAGKPTVSVVGLLASILVPRCGMLEFTQALGAKFAAEYQVAL